MNKIVINEKSTGEEIAEFLLITDQEEKQAMDVIGKCSANRVAVRQILDSRKPQIEPETVQKEVKPEPKKE